MKQIKAQFLILVLIFCKNIVDSAKVFQLKENRFLLIRQPANQNEALAGCLLHGGQLVMILTKQVDDDVMEIMTTEGIRRLMTSLKFNPASGFWEWSVNATKMDYNGFEGGTVGAEGKCAHKLITNSGKWRSTDCSTSAEAFLCEL